MCCVFPRSCNTSAFHTGFFGGGGEVCGALPQRLAHTETIQVFWEGGIPPPLCMKPCTWFKNQIYIFLTNQILLLSKLLSHVRLKFKHMTNCCYLIGQDLYPVFESILEKHSTTSYSTMLTQSNIEHLFCARSCDSHVMSHDHHMTHSLPSYE